MPPSRQYYVNALEEYIAQRENEKEYHGIFWKTQTMSQSLKVDTARELCQARKDSLQGNTRSTEVRLNYQVKDDITLKALNDKRLGKIVQDMKTNGVLELVPAPK